MNEEFEKWWEENKDLKQFFTTRDAFEMAFLAGQATQKKRDAELKGLLSNVKGLIENSTVSSGVCMCGASLSSCENNNPWQQDHSPTDSGQYYAEILLEDIAKAIEGSE